MVPGIGRERGGIEILVSWGVSGDGKLHLVFIELVVQIPRIKGIVHQDTAQTTK